MRVLPRLVLTLVAVAGTASNCFAATTPTPRETPHILFVQEYERELAAIEEIHLTCQKEEKDGKGDEFSKAIYCSTLMQMERRMDIRTLNGMHLGGDFKTLIPTLTAFYQKQIELDQRLIDISTKFLSGPKTGIEYGNLAAEIPQLRAKLEYADRAILETIPLVASTLIDMNPDSENHMSHLLITSEQRESLLTALTRDFGSQLDEKDQDCEVSAAKVLRFFLEKKGFRTSDELWD